MKNKYYIRIIFLSLFFCLAPLGNNLYAQWSIGVAAGANLSSLDVAEQSVMRRLTYHAGIVSNLYLIELGKIGIALQPELRYSRKGTIFPSTDTEVASAVNISLDYLELPIGVHVQWNLRSCAPFVAVVPYGAYLLRDSKMINNGDIVNIEEDSKNFPDIVFRNFDAGVKVGTGVGFWDFQLSAYYTWGLFNVAEKIANVPQNVDAAFVRNIEISLGYFF